MNNKVKLFLLLSFFFVNDLYAAEIKENEGLLLLKSAITSGIDPLKLKEETTKSLNANELLLSFNKDNKTKKANKESKANISNQLTVQNSADEEEFKLSASSLPNNAKQVKVDSKNYEQHELCESEIIKAEQRYGIPKRLLLAIATVESGKSCGKTKKPWPWTICANGRGYYCSTKSAAIATVKRLMARGIRNIDVGCMQINLMHHSTAFKNLEEAFTPKSNINYAARFLVQLRNTYKSWTSAVGYYHSKLSKHYKPYCVSVYKAWNKVKNVSIKNSVVIERAASKVKSDISYLPSYYSLVDNNVSSKLHQLGKKTLLRSAPKFYMAKEKAKKKDNK